MTDWRAAYEKQAAQISEQKRAITKVSKLCLGALSAVDKIETDLVNKQLKLGRPKQYIEYHKQLLSEFGSDQHIDTILRKVQALGGY